MSHIIPLMIQPMFLGLLLIRCVLSYVISGYMHLEIMLCGVPFTANATHMHTVVLLMHFNQVTVETIGSGESMIAQMTRETEDSLVSPLMMA